MMFQNGDVIGPYTIDQTFSDKGGMSQVFLAHETQRPHYVAVIKAQMTDGNRKDVLQDMLRQEAEYLRQLRHPGIIHIYPLRIDRDIVYAARAYDYSSQPWYYVMEYIRKENNLDNYIGRIKKFPIEWTIELFYQLLIVVQYLHQQGFAHCDLKPHNILFRYSPSVNETPLPVLIDFGSATIVKQGIRQLSASIRYSPPEVIWALDRKDISANKLIRYPRKIDIWALGAILFEMITGRPLIHHKRRNAITTTILRGKLDTIRDLRPDVHPSLDKLMSAMLRQDPAKRPTIGELIEAVEERIYTVRPPRISLETDEPGSQFLKGAAFLNQFRERDK